MVYEKNKSGDPDYDDKVPLEQHSGGVVSAGDGVWLSPVLGPIDAEGAHVNLAVDEMDLDNRPAPGEQAEKASEVQQYRPEDVPTLEQEADSKDVDAAREGQRSVRVAAEQQGQVPLNVATDEEASGTFTPETTGGPADDVADTSTKTPPAKKANPAAKDTSSK